MIVPMVSERSLIKMMTEAYLFVHFLGLATPRNCPLLSSQYFHLVSFPSLTHPSLVNPTLTGIGGARIPYDVNTALVPAALRSISRLSLFGLFPTHPSWCTLASSYAKTWEDNTLSFFAVSVPAQEAESRLQAYISRSSFPGPSQSQSVDSDVKFYALGLEGNNNLSKVEVMNTDDCFRLFLLNTTNQSQLSAFLNQTANNIRRTFPAGLMTSVGMLVANPAFGPDPVYAANVSMLPESTLPSLNLTMRLETQSGRTYSSDTS